MMRVALMVLALGLVACEMTPRQRWVAQRQAITLAQDGAVVLHRGNAISDEDLLRVESWVVTARTLNWRAYFKLQSGQEGDAETIMAESDQYVDRIELYTGSTADGD